MRTNNIEKTIADLIILPRYRILRHALLIVAMVAISVNIVLELEEYYSNKYHLILGMFYYCSIVLIALYSNMYIGVRKLLLKNKIFYYFLFLSTMVTFILLMILMLQKSIITEMDAVFYYSKINFLIGMFSSFIILSLVLSGCTTLQLFKYWLLSDIHITELKRTSLQSELQYLKNQINPHFLFNMLNGVNVLLKEKKGGAAQLMHKIQDLLNYQLNGSAQDTTTLSSDIVFLNDFLNLEKIRRDRFEYSIATQGNMDHIVLPPLLFIPFVENAVKYSQDSDNDSYVNIQFSIEKDILFFRCENSIPAYINNHNKTGGIGLKNIQRRLELLYPERHSLKINETETQFSIEMKLKINL